MAGLRLGIGSIAVALLTTVGAAQACGDGTVALEDKFATFEPTWGSPSDAVDVKDGHMVITPDKNYTNWVVSSASVFDDVDVCADFTSVNSVDPGNSYAGLIFWYQDDDNFYVLEYDADGNASVWRRQRARWLKQLAWKKFDSIKPKDGSVNQLRVVTNGPQATLYINGDQFGTLKGQPPANGQQVGMLGASPEKDQATYSVTNFVVTEPAKSN